MRTACMRLTVLFVCSPLTLLTGIPKQHLGCSAACLEQLCAELMDGLLGAAPGPRPALVQWVCVHMHGCMRTHMRVAQCQAQCHLSFVLPVGQLTTTGCVRSRLAPTAWAGPGSRPTALGTRPLRHW